MEVTFSKAKKRPARDSNSKPCALRGWGKLRSLSNGNTSCICFKEAKSRMWFVDCSQSWDKLWTDFRQQTHALPLSLQATTTTLWATKVHKDLNWNTFSFVGCILWEMKKVLFSHLITLTRVEMPVLFTKRVTLCGYFLVAERAHKFIFHHKSVADATFQIFVSDWKKKNNSLHVCLCKMFE